MPDNDTLDQALHSRVNEKPTGSEQPTLGRETELTTILADSKIGYPSWAEVTRSGVDAEGDEQRLQDPQSRKLRADHAT